MAHLGARAKVKVSSLGKWKTIVQMVGLSLMVYRSDLFGLPIYAIGIVLLVIAAVLTLWSMVLYLQVAWPELRKTTVS
jgi:phosphatidylglycerophosphate synthase